MNDLIRSFETDAPLPETYQHVVRALAECVSIDECKSWADKAAALKSYAKQAGDPRLREYAMKIQGRAVARCGELLKQYDGKGNNQHTTGAHSKLTQREAADAAGLSPHQQFQAVQVANVPADVREALFETGHPPTVTTLAEMGTRKQPPIERPPGFAAATNFMDLAGRLARFCRDHQPAPIAEALMAHERADTIEDTSAVIQWGQSLLNAMEEQQCREI